MVLTSTEFLLNTLSEADPVSDCDYCLRLRSDSRVGVAGTVLLLFDAALLEAERAGEFCNMPPTRAPFESGFDGSRTEIPVSTVLLRVQRVRRI